MELDERVSDGGLTGVLKGALLDKDCGVVRLELGWVGGVDEEVASDDVGVGADGWAKDVLDDEVASDDVGMGAGGWAKDVLEEALENVGEV